MKDLKKYWKIVKDNPKVATIVKAAAFLIGLITKYSQIDPITKPIRGTINKANQKFPVVCNTNQASTDPTIKKSPWAMFITSKRPKIIDNPNAIKAMISPHIKPFKARTIKVSINYFFSTLIGCVLNLLILKSKISNLL